MDNLFFSVVKGKGNKDNLKFVYRIL